MPKFSDLQKKTSIVSVSSFIMGYDASDTSQASTGTTVTWPATAFQTLAWSVSSNYGIQNISPVYSTVSSNSANWNYQGTDIKNLTGNWQNTYSTVSSNSATNWNYQGTDIKSLTANWKNTYSTVSSNSANWNYQGTDIKSLTANWQNTYSTVSSNSATWGTGGGGGGAYLPLAGGIMADNATIGFDNSSAIREAGAQGLEIECSVGYRWQWVAGRMILRQINSGQIQRVLGIDGVTPGSSDDSSNGFIVGTRWETQNGTIYECTNSTNGAAVWEVQAGSAPAQVSGPEITAGTETALRSYSPADVTAQVRAQQVHWVHNLQGSLILSTGGAVPIDWHLEGSWPNLEKIYGSAISGANPSLYSMRLLGVMPRLWWLELTGEPLNSAAQKALLLDVARVTTYSNGQLILTGCPGVLDTSDPETAAALTILTETRYWTVVYRAFASPNSVGSINGNYPTQVSISWSQESFNWDVTVDVENQNTGMITQTETSANGGVLLYNLPEVNTLYTLRIRFRTGTIVGPWSSNISFATTE